MKVDDLEVYQKLFGLTLDLHELTLAFPKYELYELGSQLRRSSNSVPANIAEGFGNKHSKIYLESISRAMGELRETMHHLKIAGAKGYVEDRKLHDILNRYEECSKMLYGLEQSLLRSWYKQPHN